MPWLIIRKFTNCYSHNFSQTEGAACHWIATRSCFASINVQCLGIFLWGGGGLKGEVMLYVQIKLKGVGPRTESLKDSQRAFNVLAMRSKYYSAF